MLNPVLYSMISMTMPLWSMSSHNSINSTAWGELFPHCVDPGALEALVPHLHLTPQEWSQVTCFQIILVEKPCLNIISYHFIIVGLWMFVTSPKGTSGHALPQQSIISGSFDFVTSPKITILWSFCGHLMVILWLVMARYSLNHRSGRPFNCVALPKRRLWGYSSPWPPNIKAQTSVTGVSDADVVLRCIGLIGWKTWNKRTG